MRQKVFSFLGANVMPWHIDSMRFVRNVFPKKASAQQGDGFPLLGCINLDR